MASSSKTSARDWGPTSKAASKTTPHLSLNMLETGTMTKRVDTEWSTKRRLVVIEFKSSIFTREATSKTRNMVTESCLSNPWWMITKF